MFVIKNNQVERLREEALKNFEDEMVNHVATFFPNHFISMKEDGVRTTIRYGYAKATTYELTTQRNVCLYLNNMLLLGSNFDLDPQYPWAHEILTDIEQAPAIRIDKISDKTLEFISQASGPSNIYIYRAILSLTKNADNILQRLLSCDLSDAHDQLALLFAKKYETVGRSNLDQMLKAGAVNAKRYGIRADPNILIYIVFMFMMGSGFDEDPQFPWIAAILNDPDLTDERRKVEVLYHTTIDNLKEALSNYKH